MHHTYSAKSDDFKLASIAEFHKPKAILKGLKFKDIYFKNEYVSYEYINEDQIISNSELYLVS